MIKRSPPKVFINATEKEYYRIAAHFFKIGVVDAILFQAIFSVDGVVMLNGLFGVGKKVFFCQVGPG